jgi:hypothetical protein
MNWANQFKNRVDDFEKQYGDLSGVSISIKIKVDSGCFHREHSPKAYEIIDSELENFDSFKEKAVLIEHESGPEILVYLSLVVGSIGLTTATVNMITAIINARKKGTEHGDRHDSSINLIVRNFNKKGEIKEEKIITIDRTSNLDRKILKELLEKGIRKLLEK